MLRWDGQLARKPGAVTTQVRDVQLSHLRLQLQHQLLCQLSQHPVAHSIAMLAMMSGPCSGSKAGEVPRKSTAAKQLEEVAHLSSHHHQELLLQAFQLHQILVHTTVKLDTIRATRAWRSIGPQTS